MQGEVEGYVEEAFYGGGGVWMWVYKGLGTPQICFIRYRDMDEEMMTMMLF
jgi:hypothetical protein